MSFLGEALLLGIPSIIVFVLVKGGLIQGSNPSNVSLSGAQVVDDKPYKLPPLKRGASTHMNMGLRKFESLNWLTIDEYYLSEHNIRSRLLSDHLSSVLQCLPGSESACHEVLSAVTSFLTSRYPYMFRFTGSGRRKMIQNLQTGESFPVENNPRPLETAARLAMEDFNLLIKDPINGEYRLKASATLFPAGWKLEDRIGYTLTELHCPVPAWKDKLGPHVNRYFDHLTTKTAMERHTLFVQTTPDLFRNDSLCSPSDALMSAANQILPASGPNDEPDGTLSSTSDETLNDTDVQVLSNSRASKTCSLSEIYVRRERQTFTRLPKSDAILFTVRTFMTRLTLLGDEELTAFVEQAKGWGSEMAAYKGREQWWDTVLKYQEERKCGSTTRY